MLITKIKEIYLKKTITIAFSYSKIVLQLNQAK